MRIKRLVALSFFFLVAMFSIGGMFAFASTASEKNSPHSKGPQDPPGFRQGPRKIIPPGLPAITPRKNITPAVTLEDVKLYVQKHSFSGGSTISGKPATIETIKYITCKDAQVLMNGESLGIPEDSMVYYVVLRGPFFLSNMSVPPGMDAPGPAPTGIEVFDAQTGVLLVWGA